MAGLTPENISSALSAKFTSEELADKKISDLVDMMYKSSIMDYYGALTREASTPESTFVEDAPGYGSLTLDQYKALSTSDKEYISYVLAARELGQAPMSKDEFDKTPDKDKIPTTAMGVAIAGYVEETGKLPPENELSRWTKLFREEPAEKTPSPVTWTTATNELQKRFGKLDQTGMWAVTSELQATHRKAQEILVDLQDQGVDPLRAVNEAENKARDWQKKIEDRYFQYIQDAGRDDEKVDKVKSAFYEQYGYIPVQRSY